jgi:hypothetical protein
MVNGMSVRLSRERGKKKGGKKFVITVLRARYRLHMYVCMYTIIYWYLL